MFSTQNMIKNIMEEGKDSSHDKIIDIMYPQHINNTTKDNTNTNNNHNNNTNNNKNNNKNIKNNKKYQ